MRKIIKKVVENLKYTWLNKLYGCMMLGLAWLSIKVTGEGTAALLLGFMAITCFLVDEDMFIVDEEEDED